MEQTPTTRQNIQNPYAKGTRSEYQMGSIEQFLHDKLGFRTGYDQYNEQMDNAAAEWETQNQSLGYEEQYNSAAAQAERMREAGLNPDLKPDSVAPGQAAEMTEKENVPDSPAGIDIEAFQKASEISSRIAAIALDAVTGGAGIFSTLTNGAIGIANAGIDLDTKEANLGLKLRQMADESYGELKPYIDSFKDLSGGVEWGAKTFGQAGDYLAKTRGLSGRNKKKFATMYNAMVNSSTAKMKELEKQGKITEMESNPIIAAPYMYKQIEMTKAKHDATVWEIMLWKSQEESKVLAENPELFRGMTSSEMRQKISEAVTAGNEAEISKYNKAIKALDKIDREAEQKQRNADREFIHNWIPLDNWKAYQQANQRIYGVEPSGITVFGKKFE